MDRSGGHQSLTEPAADINVEPWVLSVNALSIQGVTLLGGIAVYIRLLQGWYLPTDSPHKVWPLFQSIPVPKTRLPSHGRTHPPIPDWRLAREALTGVGSMLYRSVWGE